MRIKVDRRREGDIPSEAVVAISTTSGPEEVIVHESQVDSKGLEVGFIREMPDKMLIELPRRVCFWTLASLGSKVGPCRLRYRSRGTVDDSD